MPKAPSQVFERQHPELSFDYQIRLSKRKTVGISIKQQQVVLAAPLGTPFDGLEKWLLEKSSWVERKLLEQSERETQIPQRQFISGESWPFLDASLTLEVVSGKKAVTGRFGDRLIVVLGNRSRLPTETQTQKAIEQWYKQQALELLSRKTHTLAQQLGTKVNSVTVKRTRSKWGHCTRARVIQYNWLITQAPEWVVDYLVAHEVCHLFHHNHSKAYWQKVARVYPDYERAEIWLKQKSHLLTL